MTSQNWACIGYTWEIEVLRDGSPKESFMDISVKCKQETNSKVIKNVQMHGSKLKLWPNKGTRTHEEFVHMKG